MRRVHLTASRGISTSRGRLGWRSCLQKECGRKFLARRYNQRYCRDPECLRKVQRWHAAKRQQKCRSEPEGRQRHAKAERQRRKQRASQPQNPPESQIAVTDTPVEACAWSRSRKFSEIFCDRPGCYEPLRNSPRAPASYCSDDCCAAMRRARDRERKWLSRKTKVGRFKRHLEYQAARDSRRQGHIASGDMALRQSLARSNPKAHTVPVYWCNGDSAIDLTIPTEVISHDPQTDFSSRPRAPPTS
jgi:hypothetical protein